MSNRALTWAFEQELKSGPKFVLVALADWADDEGSCFPGVATIARRVGSAESAVRENLSRLKQAGLIVEERRNRANGARTSNRYWLQMKGRVNLTPESGGADLTPESDVPNAGIRGNLTPESGGESEPLVVNPQRNPSESPTAQTLIAEWIDNCTTRPPSRVIGQVAKEVGVLLGEGIPYPTVRAGMGRWHSLALHPSALASVVNEVMNPPTASRGRSPATAVAAGRDLVARLEARSQTQMIERGA